MCFRFRELQRLDERLHWFCERQDAVPLADPTNGLEQEDRKPSKIEASVESRREQVVQCLQLFAYDSPELVSHKAILGRNIDRQLGKCDVCIVEYYKGKRSLIEKLIE